RGGMAQARHTPVEVVGVQSPLRVEAYAWGGGSGGVGRGTGGEGVIREFVALAPMEASILAERRRHAPRGAAGGRDGARGSTCLNGAPLGPKVSVSLAPGDVLRLETPGGGGWGAGGKPERGDKG